MQFLYDNEIEQDLQFVSDETYAVDQTDPSYRRADDLSARRNGVLPSKNEGGASDSQGLDETGGFARQR